MPIGIAIIASSKQLLTEIVLVLSFVAFVIPSETSGIVTALFAEQRSLLPRLVSV